MLLRSAIFAFLVVLAAQLTPGSAAADPVAVAVTKASAAARDDATRVEIEVVGDAEGKSFLLEAPDRFVVDVKSARLAIRGATAPGGVVRAIRYAARPNGDVRLVFDLAQPVKVSRVAPFVFELSPQTVAAARSEPSDQPVKIAAAAAPRGGRRLIVIDAGHGGKDPGASGQHVREKEVVLAAALALRDELERRGGYEVALTRSGDVFRELEDRVRFARERKADLFISLHADASGSADAQGASVYTLSEQGGDRAKAMMRSQDWKIDHAARYSASVESILVDLAQRETTNRSADFAQTLIRTLAPVAPLLRRTHRSAGYFVLLAPDVPAVLLEMGFMTNPDDERRLSSEAQRKEMMKAVSDAIDVYFDRSRAYAGGG